MSQFSSGLPSAHDDVLKGPVPDDEAGRASLVTELKNRGNAAFKARQMPIAIALYSRGIEIDESNAVLWSNRSAVHELMEAWEDALSDASKATEHDPTYAKGWFRKGKALGMLKRRHGAVAALEEACKLEPKKKVLQKALDAAREAAKGAPPDDSDDSTAEKSAPEPSASKAAAADAPQKKKKVAKAEKQSDHAVEEGVFDDSIKKSDVIRGYKKTKDGRTTSYFTMEVDEKAKKLIGSIAPKKLEANEAAAAASSAPVAVGSVWNSGGTYEEGSRTSWAEKTIRSKLSSLSWAGEGGWPRATVDKVSKIDGEAQVITTRGKRRNIFDFEVDVDLTVQLAEDAEKSFTLVLFFPEFSSDMDMDEGGCEVQIKKRGEGCQHDVAKAVARAMRGLVTSAVAEFAQEFASL